MGSLSVLWLSVTCCLICVLCRDALGESTKVPASINDASETEDARSMLDTENARLIRTQAGPDDIALRDEWSNFEVPQPPLASETSGNSGKARCSRYCIRELGTREEDSSKDDDICVSWFERNQSEGVDFSLEDNAEMSAPRRILVDKKNSNNCQIYLDSDGNVINVGANSISERSKIYSSSYRKRQNDVFRNPFPSAVPKQPNEKLLHWTNLDGYTEANFHVDPDTTAIIINITGNLTRAALTIPIRGNGTTRRLRIIMSLARARSTKGVVVGARSLPPGIWCVKLTGVENPRYNFNLHACFEDSNRKNEVSDTEATSESGVYDTSDARDAVDSETTVIDESEQFNKLGKENISNDQIGSTSLDSGIKNKTRSIIERSIEITDPKDMGEETTIYNSRAFSSAEFAVENVTGYPQNASNEATFDNARLIAKQQQRIQERMSEVASLNEDADMETKSFAVENVSTRVADGDRNQQLSSDFAGDSDGNILERKKMLIELNANSNLIATAGTTHRVIFDVSNSCFLLVRYAIRARSTPFRIYNVQPTYMWLYPGQTSHVAVDIIIPPGSQDTVNTLTLSLGGTEVSEKTVYVYVQNAFSKINDDTGPTIEYSFNNNCGGKTDKNRCEKTVWSADITVQDSDSGLKRVLSAPNQIYSRTTFISGTREPVKFYYSSTCCSTTVKITAIDVSNNQYSRTLDVTAWDNLSQGEIAAIALGALFLLLLLILLIIAIVFCIRRKSSHDLPYTQRYGSRPPARSERTSF